MRIPVSWLREWVDVPADATGEDIHAALVSVGFEEEAIHASTVVGPVVVGQVLEFQDEPQSNGKTIRWCQVRVAPEGETAADGGADVRGIVCGAHNFEAGDLVVVCLPGAVLPGDFAIAARKTYGHVSDGMLASARELGLGEDHSGIMRLNTMDIEAPLGSDAKALLGLDDFAVEINVTPDRGYALSIRGIAREYSHATGATFRDPALAVSPQPADGFRVEVVDDAPIRDQEAVRVFHTRVVRGIDQSRPTPAWMASRLRLAGIRPISLAVDITNYVMIELGQPLHGYDLDLLQGGITVRRAAAGERLTTLDGVERTLHTEDLLITDDSGPIGLAGVMGGATTELSETTTNVLIEAAVFSRFSIARTARRHKLPSEASRRFERGVDPNVSAAAAERAVQLLVELAGGTADSLGSSLVRDAAAPQIALPADGVASLIGVDYAPEAIAEALTKIGAEVRPTTDGWLVTPPSWRPDLAHKADLVEEVARLIGYDTIPEQLPVAPPGRGLTRTQRLRRAAANALAGAGMTEVNAYPFLAAGANAAFARDDVEASAPEAKLANPLDGEAPFLRRSLLPGLVALAHRNHSRGLNDLALFETGAVFRPEPGVTYGHETLPVGGQALSAADAAALGKALPPQPRYVAMLCTGNRALKQPGQSAHAYSWRDALEAVQQLARGIGATVEVRQGSHAAFHPGRTADLVVPTADGDVVVGVAGELLPKLAEEHHLPRVVAAAELDLDALIANTPADVVAGTVWPYPAATQDLSLVVDIAVPAGDLLAAVREGAGSLLEDIRVVDDYRGEGVPAGQKSVTFALRFRAADRTLTAAEATEAKLAGVAVAEQRFQAQVRA